MTSHTASPARALLPLAAAFGAFSVVGLFAIDLVVAQTAQKTGNCFAPGSLGDQWINGTGGYAQYIGAASVLVALAGVAFAAGRRLFCFGVGLLAAGATFLCLLMALGNAICEY